MRLTFRIKFLILVGITLFALTANILSIRWASTFLQSRFTEIQSNYLPKVIQGPKFVTTFGELRRAFQDAVSASDKEALEETRVIKNSLLSESLLGSAVLSDSDRSDLKTAIEMYYDSAHDVSRRMIARENSASLLEATSAMQTKHKKATEILNKVLAYDANGLEKSFLSITQTVQQVSHVGLLIAIVALLCLVLLSWTMSRSLVRSLDELISGFRRFGQGQFESPIQILTKDEFGKAASFANEMAKNLRALSLESQQHNWTKDGQTGLAKELVGKVDPDSVANSGLEFICKYLEIPMAALYFRKDNSLQLLGHYAFPQVSDPKKIPQQFQVGEGLTGQAILREDFLLVTEIPSNYWHVESGFGDALPSHLAFLPLRHMGSNTGVLEFALFKPLTDIQKELLLILRESLSITIQSALSRSKTEELYKETQLQAQELSRKEGELRASNEELQSQQEELQQSNEELEEQRASLEAEKEKLENLTSDLEQARNEAVLQAKATQQASQHKSEFLANMSHELRTPLNSIMVLSELLSENLEGNLSAQQVSNSKAIHSSGKDLLALIGDILDLSKVEAGKLDISVEECRTIDFESRVEKLFLHQIQAKGLSLNISISDDAPKTIKSDFRRVEQIIRNLVANALKFTEKGGIEVKFFRPNPASIPFKDLPSTPALAISVRDSGIGIPDDQQNVIFEAFKQLDSSVRRKYQGTGLGLAISLNMARRLGGEISLRSKLGEGSTFTLYLPANPDQPISNPQGASVKADPSPHPRRSQTVAEREELEKEKMKLAEKLAENIFEGKKLLIVDDDMRNVYVLRQVILPTKADILTAGNGREALEILEKNSDVDLVLMDIMMPEMSGIEAIQAIRKSRNHKQTPIIALTAKAMKKDKEECLEAGANDYLSKPVDVRKLISLLQVWLSNVR